MLPVTLHDLVRFTAVYAPDGYGEIDQGVGPIRDTLETPVTNTGIYTLTVTDTTGTGTAEVEIGVTQDPLGAIDVTNLEEDLQTVDTRLHPTFVASLALPGDNTVVSTSWRVSGGTFSGTGPITVTPGDIDAVVLYCAMTTAEGTRAEVRRTINIRPSLPTVNVLQTKPWDLPIGPILDYELRADDKQWAVSGSSWNFYPGRRFRISAPPAIGWQIRVTVGFLDDAQMDLQTTTDLSDAGHFWRWSYDFTTGEGAHGWFIFNPQPGALGDLVVEVNAYDALNGPFGRFSINAELGVWIDGPATLYQNQTGAYFAVPESPDVPKTWSTSDGTIYNIDGAPDNNAVNVDIHSYPNFTIQCTLHFPGGDYVATYTNTVQGM